MNNDRTLDQRIDHIEAALNTWNEKNGSPASRAWDIATKLSVPVVLGIAIAMLTLWRDVAIIQATRFSRDDGRQLESRIDATNPEWLRQSIAEIKATIGTIQRDVGRLPLLEQRVNDIGESQKEHLKDHP